MVRATVCQAVSLLEKRRERRCAPGGPCLSPLDMDCYQLGGSNIGRVTLGWGGPGRDEPIEIHSPKRQDGKHLEAPRLGRRSAEDVVEHVGCRSGRVTEVWEKALVKHSSHPSETRDTESKQNRQTERQEASKRSTSGGDRYVAGKVE
jgi:hypothetical protein